MATTCRAFQTEEEARAEVEHLLATGISGDEIGDASRQRTGGFADLDRETVTTYADGVKRVRIASHRDLKRMLVDAGLDPETAATDVDALHHGRVLVLAR
jgi:hypothetical protein